MIYDVCAKVRAKDEKSQDEFFQYVVNASSPNHLNLLLEKHLPKGADIIGIQLNPEITKVQVINPKGKNIIKVITLNHDSNELPEVCNQCELVDRPDNPVDELGDQLAETFCLANSINEVLAKLTELEYEGDIIEISLFTENVSYIF